MKTNFTLYSLIFVIALLCNPTTTNAQLANGAVAPDWTFTDINGNSHNLYTYLNQGKNVVLDFSATWCPPCWSYHQTHVLENLWNARGPSGTDDVMVFMIEADASTNEACLYGQSGCNNTSLGDWTVGVTYPILNLNSADASWINNNYNINFFPTLYNICPDKRIFEVGQPPQQAWENWIISCGLTASGAVTSNELCFGNNSGAITANSNGGFGAPMYQWSNGATTQNLSNVGAGTYTLTVTEGQGYFVEVGPLVITGPAAPLAINTGSITNVNCNGSANGSINTVTTGGTSGYQYMWNTGSNQPNISGLSGGSYILTVTDGNNCVEIESFTISEPSALTLTATQVAASCGQNNGIIVLDATGGTGSFTFDIGSGPTSNNQFFNLAPGLYNTMVTDGNGCTNTQTIIVNNITSPSANAGSSQSLDCSSPQTVLNGSTNATGSNITYTWTTNTGNIVSGGNTLTPTVDATGLYTLFVTDTNTGCFSTSDVIVLGNTTPPNSNAGAPQSLNCVVNTATLDGSASSTGPTFSYVWTTANGNIVSGATTLSPTVNAAGTYELTVLNSINSCEATSTVLVTADALPPSATASVSGEINCNNNSVTLDGSSSSGSGSLSYVWLDGSNNVIGNSATITVTNAGTYTLEVTDNNNGCINSTTSQVNSNIAVPTAIAAASNMLTCTNTTATLDAAGSSSGSNITYTWLDVTGNVIGNNATVQVSNAGLYYLEVLDNNNGCSEQSSVTITSSSNLPTSNIAGGGELICGQSSVTLDGAGSSTGSNITYSWVDANGNVLGNNITQEVSSAGMYELIVTNNGNGCTSSSSTIVTANMNIPTANATANSSLTCINSTVTLDGSASSSGNNFSYQWIDASGNTIGSSITTEVSISGNYSLIVTDGSNNCTSTTSIQVTEDYSTPTANAGAGNQIDCITSSVTLDGSASSSGNNFSYQWNDASGNTVSTSVTANVSSAGTYTLLVTNNDNGCESFDQVTVTASNDFPTVAVNSSNELNCNNQSTQLSGIGSSSGSDYTYEWFNSSGASISSNLEIDVTAADNYTLVVTNATNGCSASSNVIVLENTNLPNVAATTQSILDCINTSTSIDGTGSSTGSAFSYQWVDQNGTVISTDLITQVSSVGTYTLLVTNNDNGCTNEVSTQVTASTDIPIASISDPMNFNCNISSIILDATNSSTGSDISYLWTTTNGFIISGETTLNPTVGSPGIFIFSVTNTSTGCVATSEVVVSETPGLDIVLQNQVDADCFNSNSGSAQVMVMGGTGSYTYSWSNGGIQPSINNALAGTYTVMVTDTDNCSETLTVTINEPAELIGNATSTNESSFQGNNGTANANPSGGTSGYTYLWSTGATTASIDGLAPGQYTVTIIDANGCETMETITVEEFDCTAAAGVSLINISCNGANDGQATASLITQGIATYLWNNGMTTSTISNLSAGTYTVTVTDNNGCASIEEVEITEPTAIAGTIVDVAHVECLTSTNGSATVEAQGGIGNLSYLWSNGSTTVTASNLGAGIYTVTMTDDNFCTNTETVEILASDIEIPIAVTQNIIASLDNSGNVTISPNSIDGGSTDNCEIVDMLLDVSQFDCSNLGINTVMLTVVDGSGNMSTATATVEIQDLMAPVVDCVDNIFTNSCNGVTYSLPTATDNCIVPAPMLVSGLPSGEIFPIGTTEIVYLFVDEAGNEATCTFNVTVENTLDAGMVAADPIPCNGGVGALTINVTGGSTPYNYLWSDGQTTETASNLSPGDYTLTVTDANGCEIISQAINLPEPPAIEVTVEGVVNATNGQNNGSIDVTVDGGTMPYTFEWFSNGTLVGDTEDLLFYPPGVYDLTVTDGNGCVVIYDPITIENMTGNENVLLEKNIQVAPNPTDGLIFIDIDLPKNSEIQIDVFDVTGKNIISTPTKNISQEQIQLDLSKFSNGVYILKVKVDDGVLAKRVVLQKG